MITEDELKALTDYIAELENQVSELTAQVDYLTRERILHTEGREALLRTTNPVADVLEPLPPGVGRGTAGQLIYLTHEACVKYNPNAAWFKPTPHKRVKKLGTEP